MQPPSATKARTKASDAALSDTDAVMPTKNKDEIKQTECTTKELPALGCQSVLGLCPRQMKAGAVYVGIMVIRNAVPMSIGCLCGSVVTGALANLAGQAMLTVRDSSHDSQTLWFASLTHHRWTDQVLEELDMAAFLPFGVWRAFLLVLAANISMICLVDAWRGLGEMQCKRKFWCVLVVGACLHFLAQLAQLLILSTGWGLDPTKPSSVNITKVPPYTVWLAQSACLLAIAGPEKSRCQKILPCVGLLLTVLISFFGTGILISSFFSMDGLAKLAIPAANVALLAPMAHEAAVYCARALPDSNNDVALVVGMCVSSLTITPNFIMQFGASDMIYSVGVSVIMVTGELLTHNLWLRGQSIPGLCAHFCRRCAARCLYKCCGHKKNKVSPFSVAEEVVDGSMDSCAHPAVRLGRLVAYVNDREWQTTWYVAVLFLVAKMNPNEAGGKPIAWEDVLARFAVGLMAEMLNDFLTAVLASWLSQDVIRASDGFALHESRPHARRKHIILTTILACFLSISRTVGGMCPVAADDGNLLSLSRCS